EDGIRAFHVTGVQTCALPISDPPSRQAQERATQRAVRAGRGEGKGWLRSSARRLACRGYRRAVALYRPARKPAGRALRAKLPARSEERRGGEGGRWRRAGYER